MVVEVNGLPIEGVLLKSLKDYQRNTILIPRAHGLLAQLYKDEKIGENVRKFFTWARKNQKEWGLGKTGTLKKIERLASSNSTPPEFDLRAVAHHYGAVPVLTVGELQSADEHFFVTVLPSLDDLRIIKPIQDKTEILLSFVRHLPNLLTAYYEQIGFYLRSIFFGADEKHIIKYAHRIRSILVGSIRGKVEEIRRDHFDKDNRLIANNLRFTYEHEIQIAEAVDAFGHLLTNYIYSFFSMESNVTKYEKRLEDIVYGENIMGDESPVAFLQECARHISESKDNVEFVSTINSLKTHWLIPFGEAAAFIGEIKRTCGKNFYVPTIFVGYHFDIEANEQAFEELKSAVIEHWPHVRLLRGRHLARNIRWSLLGRIWVSDAYLFLIPPSFITRDGTKKPLNRKEDWLFLEFIYTVLISKHCVTMKPKQFKSEVFEEFKAHLESYAPDQEIHQIKEGHWEANLVKAKEQWRDMLRNLERLPSMDAFEANSLAEFEEGILDPLHEKLIRLFFRAAYWYLEPDALLVLQTLLKQFHSGSGQIERKELRKLFKSLNSKYEFSTGLNNLLDFNFDFFDKLEPLVLEGDGREITLRLADVIDVLCNNFCCRPQRIDDHIIGQMLSPRQEDR